MIFRRAIAMAAEDIGLADPEALKLAVAARDAYHMLGAPEGYLPLAQMVDLPRDGAEVEQREARRWSAALEAAREHPAGPVPLHIRNAPTKLMKELGYHEGYQYAHDVPEAYIPQEYLPERLRRIARSTSRARSASRRRSRSGWRGGRSCGLRAPGSPRTHGRGTSQRRSERCVE